METKPNQLTYLPELDGIRGILCIWVLLTHWDLRHFPTGWIAMGVFFLLSGFLIGRILIKSDKSNVILYFKNYFINRVLRIFPLYYLAILLFFSLSFLLKNQTELFKAIWEYQYEHIWYFILHGVNVIKFSNPAVDFTGHPFLGHFWSLSLEEQFYFFLPFIILIFNKRFLKILCFSLIFLTPILTLLCVRSFEQTYNPIIARYMTYEFTLFWLEAFALGISIVLFDFKWLKNAGVYALITLLILFIVLAANYLIGISMDYPVKWYYFGMHNPLHHGHLTGNWFFDYNYIISKWLINLFIFFIVFSIYKGQRAYDFLNNKFLAYFGKRSYAMYIFHLPVLIIIWEFSIIDKNSIFNNVWLSLTLFPIYFVLILAIASFTYAYIEKPILKYRRKYILKKESN